MKAKEAKRLLAEIPDDYDLRIDILLESGYYDVRGKSAKGSVSSIWPDDCRREVMISGAKSR